MGSLGFALGFSGCAMLNNNTLYDAPTVPVPLFREENTFKAKAGYGFYTGLQGNAAYSLSDHFAVIGSGSYNHQTWVSMDLGIISSKTYRLKNHSLEGGLGYFKALKGDLFNSLEIYAGTGFGQENKNIRFTVMPNYHGAEGRFRKSFLQVNLGYADRRQAFGFANRFSVLKYPELLYYDVDDNIRVNLNRTVSFYWEPVFTFETGGEKFRFFTDLGASAPLGSTTRMQKNDYHKGSVIFCAGLSYQTGKGKKQP